jgi:hypothetical protein
LVSADARNSRNPLSVAILSIMELLLTLVDCSREDTLGLGHKANKEAFFVHIVDIRRKDAIFVNLALD